MQPEPSKLIADTAPEADAGPLDRKGGSERLCIATRTVRPVEDMIRFVAGPDGDVTPDLKGKLPGRGVWVTATRNALATAVAKGAFARGLKRQVKATTELCALTERLLEQAVLDALSMAHKAGHVLTGFSRVEAALGRDDLCALIHARDGAADGVRKLAAGLRQNRPPGAPAVLAINDFNSTQLDLALGRSNVIHAALLAGSGSESVLARYRCLIGFRASEPVSRVEKGQNEVLSTVFTNIVPPERRS
jgi:predicted RNA-binding protein YlxR (DUF448 family)